MIPLLVLALLLLAAPAWADGKIVPQSTCVLSWTAPTTNVNGTLLLDLQEYRVYLASTPPIPLAAPIAVVPAAAPNPPAGLTVTWPCSGQPAGQYYAFVTAADTSGNEGPRQPAALPFVSRDDVSPSMVPGLAAGP